MHKRKETTQLQRNPTKVDVEALYNHLTIFYPPQSHPSNEFVDARGIFLGYATNNLAEYETVITLMTNASSLGIRSLVVTLDSELVISQLTSHYSVFHPVLYWKYLRVRFLERSFDFISYKHIPRTSNSLADSFTNDILDWHLTR